MSPASLVACCCAVLLLWQGLACSSSTDSTDTQVPTVSITSPADGAPLMGSIAVRIDAHDNVGVATVELLVDGDVAAADSTAPWEFTWDTDSLAEGPHTLLAQAYDAAGNVGVSAVVHVTVGPPFALTLRNQVFTDIELTIQGQSGPQVLPAGGGRTFNYPANPGIVSYSGSTSGTTIQDTQVGLLMLWTFTVSTAGKPADTVDLTIDSTYFFIYVQNSGAYPLTNFYVNYGLASQTYDNISIPNDGQSYPIGYYPARSNTQVRAFRGNTSTYVYWNQGVHFTLPWTSNQSTELVNNTAVTALGLTLHDGFLAATSALSVPPTGAVRDRMSRITSTTRQHPGRAGK
jgi:hypothetical protein